MKMLMHEIEGWGPGAVAVGHEKEDRHPYNMVLGEMLSFELKLPRHCEAFLKVADSVQQRGGEAREVLHDKAWRVELRPSEVTVEYEHEDMGDDWKATFPFTHVRRAVQGWKRFLEMPQTARRKLVVDLEVD